MPRERIVERGSTNTLENVVFALPRMEGRVNLENVESVVVVTEWYHCRRAMMTLKRHLPVGIRYYAATYEPRGVGRADWWRSDEAARRVLKAWVRTPRYLATEDIEEIHEHGGPSSRMGHRRPGGRR